MDGKAIFFLTSHNQVDQIVPIIYKLASRGIVDLDVVLYDVDKSDYRVELVQQFDSVTVHSHRTSDGEKKIT